MRTQASTADRTPEARRTLGPRFLVAAGLALLAGCGNSSSSEFSGDLFIQTCSLACTDGTGGAQVNCGVVNVTENVELSVLFSEPIDPSTITPSTLQVTDVGNGTAPEGLRFVDPLDPRRVIFRPAISFQSGGVAFSLQRNRSYEIRIPGAAQGDAGPFIQSIEGNLNQSRLLCTVFTSEGVSDIVPGNPRVDVFVDVATAFDPMGNPIETERMQIGSDPTQAVENVSRDSKIYFEFNELMNLPTVASVVTGQSLTIFVEIDFDGDISTADRDPLPGSFELDVDQFALTTSATFTPDGEIPSAGLNRRLLVVRVTTAVRDIANLPVTSETGGGVLIAVPEILTFGTLMLPDADGENFDMPLGAEDPNASGGAWGGGLLASGLTGGSGRHGGIRVAPGETLELNTDSQDFPVSGIAQIDVLANESGMTYPNSLTVTDGVFELSTLDIAPTGRLVLRGSNPARLLVRGVCNVSPGAIIDVSGESAPPHDSTIELNTGFTTPPAGGPNGSAGGLGGDRANFPSTNNVTGVGGITGNPGAIRDGRPGGGVGGTSIGQGLGGVLYPLLLPLGVDSTESTLQDVGYSLGADPLDPLVTMVCIVQQIGASGSGGAYAENGAEGTSIPLFLPETQAPPMLPISPGPTPGGDSSALGLAPPDPNSAGYTTRLLRWQSGDLRGGASGGGGGNHPFATTNNAGGITPSSPGECLGFFTNMDRWLDHSGASGGAGGGALELLAGRQVDVDGLVNVGGGDGGDALTTLGTNGSFAMPGGGGAGGALRIRAPLVDIGPTSTIDVRGGIGGNAPWSASMGMQSRGGDGSAGLIRIEDGNSDMLSQVNFDQIRQRVLPIDPNDPTLSLRWLSVSADVVDTANVGLQRPDSMNGSTSCWIRPPGNFFQLVFRDDVGATFADQGWTMDVVIDDTMGGQILRPFRGTNAQFPTDWETQYGNTIGYGVAPGAASPIVVRFQGGRSRNPSLADPCDTNVNDPFGDVLPGSLTPWVDHPNDINVILDPAGNNYRPNMVRYCILFDRTDDGILDRPGQTLITEGVLGVTNLIIIADPD